MMCMHCMLNRSEEYNRRNTCGQMFMIYSLLLVKCVMDLYKGAVWTFAV